MGLVASEENPRAVDSRCNAYWFRRPHGPNKVPDDCCEQQVVPAVNEGASAVFVSCWDIQLEQGMALCTAKQYLGGAASDFLPFTCFGSPPS
jgi:hypothetical protein